MKQKRKVKSLIPLRNDSSVLATVLLFLGWGILLFWALALFTSLGWVASAAGGSLQYDNWIEDEVEVLLWLEIASGARSANMYFTGGTFYVEEGNNWISVDDTSVSIESNKNINYLWWDSLSSSPMSIASDNVTIIGWRGDQVGKDNDNATILWWDTNIIIDGQNRVPPVMVGWEGNEINTTQEGSAIVWWKGNKISGGGNYDFIIGWNDNNINGNRVIVWWSRVKVNNFSNLFAFSYDADSDFKPQWWNAFYLNLRRGLWLNKDAVNQWVDSNWAVGFWEVDIINVHCTNSDLWVQWNWSGCLVWCTQASMNSGYRWEMVDHGDTCEGYCRSRDDRCMVNPIEIEGEPNYTSYCTVGWVDTGNSKQCASNKLAAYENVIFETYLIDSDDECPEGQQDKCVFKCVKDFHLRVNTSSSNSSDKNTKKCYADCQLPWRTSTGGVIMIAHNDTTGAYNAEVVNCSNDAYIFPESTHIINVPTPPNIWPANQINATTKKVKPAYWKSYESCVKGTNQDYEHYKTLVCYDGTLYIAKRDGTRTNTIALGGWGEWYGYNTCELREYKCNTGTYNLDRNFILNEAGAHDTINNWNNNDREQTSWTRWVYKLCLDWFPGDTNAVCNKWNPDDNYHYQLVKCNQYYSTGTDNNPYECKKSCQMKDASWNWTYKDSAWNEYKHNRIITWYKLNEELCGQNGMGMCHEAKIVCVDGTWRMWSKDGLENTGYLYRDCSLKAYQCDENFDISLSNYNSRKDDYPHSQYDSCTPYSAKNGNKFECTADDNEYDLVDCDEWYHTEQGTSSRNKWCISDDKTVNCTNKPAYSNYNIWYNKYKWECPYASCWNVWEWVHKEGDCTWKCWNGYHKEWSNKCEYNTRTDPCTWNPDHSHWVVDTARWEWNWSSWDDPNWRMNQEDYCDWDCDSKYEEVDGACVYVPDWCSSSVCGSKDDGESCTTYKRCSNEEVVSTCRDGEWDVNPTSYGSPNLSCSSCRGCPWRDHVSDGWTCESYDQCDDTKVTSTCTDGDWDVDPKDYSSPNQWCDNSCPAVWVCPATENGWECKTYAKCSTVSRTITCENWTWSDTPYGYSAPNMWCEPCNTWCPSGPVAHGWRCTSYSTDSSCDCSGVKRVSVCRNWSWGGDDPWEYGSCSAPASCSEWWCPAQKYQYGDCSYDIPAMSHGRSDTIETETDNYDWSVAVSCNNTELSFSDPSCSRLVGCGNAPTNAEWVNGYYRKSWNGTTWTPASKAPTYTSNSSVECSYQCKTHYTWDGDSCEPDTQDGSCGTEPPSNSEWVLGTFKQTWNGNAWDPANKPRNTCVTSRPSSVECSFICDSTHKCNNDWDACIIIDTNQRCDNTVAHKCTEWWTATSTNDDDSAYRWDCKDESWCYKCKYLTDNNDNCCSEGQILKNGSCATPSYCSATHYHCTNGWATQTSATEWSDEYTWNCPDQTGCSEKCPAGQIIQDGKCAARPKENWVCDTSVCWGCSGGEQNGLDSNEDTDEGEPTRCTWSCNWINWWSNADCSIVKSCNYSCEYVGAGDWWCSTAYGSDSTGPNLCGAMQHDYDCAAQWYKVCDDWESGCRAGVKPYAASIGRMINGTWVIQTQDWRGWGPCCEWNSSIACEINGSQASLSSCNDLNDPVCDDY